MNSSDKKIPTVVIGPPCTGKTTFILNKIEEYLDNDVGIDEIAFFHSLIKQWMKQKRERHKI